MTGEPTPDAIAAEFLKSMQSDGNADPITDNGADADTTAQTTGGDGEGDDPYAIQPTDLPDVAALKRQLKGTMTKRTQQIAEERRRMQEERQQYQEAVRDAELLRALKQSPNPAEAAKALLANGNGGGANDIAATLKELEGEFEPKTLQGMAKLFQVLYTQNVQRDFLPHLNDLGQLKGDRVNNQWREVVSEFGDGANEFREAALKMQKETGLSARQCALLASDGMLKVNQIKAKVLDAKRRSTLSPSTPDKQAQPDKIALTREHRNRRIMAAAQAAGLDRLARP